MPGESGMVTREDFGDFLKPILTPRPMPALPARVWGETGWQAMRRGLHARTMEEKWDVVTEGDMVFVHRSWTGYGVFEARFVAVPGKGWRIGSAVVETHQERYRGGDAAHDAVVLGMTLGVFGRDELAPGAMREMFRQWKATLPRRDR